MSKERRKGRIKKKIRRIQGDTHTNKHTNAEENRDKR